MSVYTVQAPIGALGEAELEKSVFLREGFSWGAFWFSFIWLIWQRLWLVAVLWLFAEGFLSWLARAYISPASFLLIALALRIFLGLEANALLRRKLARRRYRLLGVVAATGLEAAERQFFSRQLAPQAGPATVPATIDAAPPMPQHRADILGVFPEPEAQR
jgi:hypothetical protein